MVVTGHHEDLYSAGRDFNASISDVRFAWDHVGIPTMGGRKLAVEMAKYSARGGKTGSTATWITP